MLYEEVVEVSERVILQDTTCQMEKKPGIPVVTGTTGEKVSDCSLFLKWFKMAIIQDILISMFLKGVGPMVRFSQNSDLSSLQHCKFKILVETINPFGCIDLTV